MIDKTIARRYAAGLLEVAVREGAVRETEAEILELSGLYESTAELRQLMDHPLVPAERKQATLREVFGTNVTKRVMKFLDILLEKGRSRLLPAIAEAFDELADQYEGLVKVEVRTFRPLDAARRARLEQTLTGLVGGRRVEITEREDASLLGGMRVRIGDVVLDGSLSGRIKSLREGLLAAVRV